MKIIADLQLHGPHARACSKNTTIQLLEKNARLKGLDLLGTADFQHPIWNKHLKEHLTEDDKGILWTKNKFPFIWQTEVSLMYSQGGKGRRIHNLIFAPNREVADQVIEALGNRGRLDYDGRPIFGFSCIELVEMMMEISEKIEIIPAHCLLPTEKIICNPEAKSILEIKKGDRVLTHSGSYKHVTETYKRPYSGKVYKIIPYYFTEGINVTNEHPFFAIKTIKNCSFVGGLCKPNSISKGKHKCGKEHFKDYKPEWITARKLEVNDVLIYPRIRELRNKKEIKISKIIGNKGYKINEKFIVPEKGRQDKPIKNIVKITPDFCRLIGYYLAEGYVNKKNNRVSFAFGQKESEYIEDVIKLMKKCFGINITKKRERHGFELYFYSKVLVNFFEKLFYDKEKPNKAFTKKLPHWFLYLSSNKQAELFRGWWRGDCGVSTSETLSTQMKLICLRLGIIPSVRIQTKEKQNSYGNKIGNRKIIASSDTYIFNNLSFYEDFHNLLEDPVFGKFKTKLKRRHGWIDENYIYVPIREIKNKRYTGFVYNLEVEKDNSYVTPSATVHNCMTPWFGLFGSKSGFDSLKECFQEKSKYIHAVETGLSADPAMMWRLPFLDDISLVSFSDAHSFWPTRLGREATIFDVKELSYDSIIQSIRTGEGLKETLEFFPEQGKYHWDGHRNCDVYLSPKRSKELGGYCPKCGKALTIGVEYRIEELAEREVGKKPASAKPYKSLIPLLEIVALGVGMKSPFSKKSWEMYYRFSKLGSELDILLNTEKSKLEEIDKNIANMILKIRGGQVKFRPGADGEYGIPYFDGEPPVENYEEEKKQKNLKDF